LDLSCLASQAGIAPQSTSGLPGRWKVPGPFRVLRPLRPSAHRSGAGRQGREAKWRRYYRVVIRQAGPPFPRLLGWVFSVL